MVAPGGHLEEALSSPVAASADVDRWLAVCGGLFHIFYWCHSFCWDWFWLSGAAAPLLITGRHRRLPSPSWHRRQRRARSKARRRLHLGRELPGDRALLDAHHGSMAPKPTDKPNPKASGKGKNKGGDAPQSSKIEFALPSAMVTSLQAITSRSTQDLWTSPAAAPTDLSVEQQAQRRASAVGKLSKRINGNLRAKEELRTALQTWMSSIGLHLAGLAQRARALGDKVDVDLSEACREMQEALAVQPSLATSEQVAAAIDAIGKPIWSLPQEQEILRLAAALRAFSVVDMPARSAEAPSEVSFGMAGMGPFGSADSVMDGGGTDGQIFGGGEHGSPFRTGATPPARELGPASATTSRDTPSAAPEGVASRAKRWRRRDGADAGRPSKSPRREEVVGPPWTASATGTTPEGTQRLQHTCIEDGGEYTRPTVPPSLTWAGAWLQILQFVTEQGTTYVGEIIRDPQQDAVLPLHDQCPEDRVELLATAEAIWDDMALAAPVVVPYSGEPNPARLAAAVAETHRGVRGDGVFDWTLPRQYGDAAHILHYPAGLCPPFVFWLLHYRGRGSVICATAGQVDWQYLAQEAHEAFLSPSFLQGAFGIQHNSRVFAYGSELVAPPHGTIVHLVRTGARPSSSSRPRYGTRQRSSPGFLNLSIICVWVPGTRHRFRKAEPLPW